METGGIIAIIIASIVALVFTGAGIYQFIKDIKDGDVTFKSIAVPVFGLMTIGFIIFILIKTL